MVVLPEQPPARPPLARVVMAPQEIRQQPTSVVVEQVVGAVVLVEQSAESVALVVLVGYMVAAVVVVVPRLTVPHLVRVVQGRKG